MAAKRFCCTSRDRRSWMRTFLDQTTTREQKMVGIEFIIQEEKRVPSMGRKLVEAVSAKFESLKSYKLPSHVWHAVAENARLHGESGIEERM